MEIFHVCSSLLGSDSIVEPGNWGRIISVIGPNHTAWQHEFELEAIRESLFREKPSRFQSCFGLPTLNEALIYRQKHCPIGIVYAAKICINDAFVHVGDCNGIQPISQNRETWAKAAQRYWSFSEPKILQPELNSCLREIVCASSIKITCRIE